MISRMRVQILGFLLSIFSTQAMATSCIGIINGIYSDIKHSSSNTLLNEHLPWMNLSWLQNNLGLANIEIITGNQTKYEWRCQNSDDIFLTMTVDQNGTLIHIRGLYTSDEGSGIFYADLNQSNFSNNDNVEPAQKPAPQPTANTNLQNPGTSLNQFPVSTDPKDFYANLRQCTPGIYQYAMYVTNATLVTPKSTIYGHQQNRCIVETAYNLPRAGKMLIKCQYKPENLAVFTDQEALSVAQKNIAFNGSHTNKVDKVINADCQIYLNGEQLRSMKKIYNRIQS